MSRKAKLRTTVEEVMEEVDGLISVSRKAGFRIMKGRTAYSHMLKDGEPIAWFYEGAIGYDIMVTDHELGGIRANKSLATACGVVRDTIGELESGNLKEKTDLVDRLIEQMINTVLIGVRVFGDVPYEKYEATEDMINTTNKHVINIGNERMPSILKYLSPYAYTTRDEGWGADIYHAGVGWSVVNGYAPFGDINAPKSLTDEYEEKAKRLQKDMDKSKYEELEGLAKKLLLAFAFEATLWQLEKETFGI